MNSGWIKLHRKLLEWEHYSKPVTRSLFIHLLLINEDGVVTASRKNLAKDLGYTEQEIRTALRNLDESGEVQIISNYLGTKIFVNNWKKYQLTNQITNQSTNQSTNLGKEEKKEAKKRRKDIQEEKEKIYIKKKKFGQYQNVLLTDEEYTKLQEEYKNNTPSVDAMIERLDEYIGQFGNKYKSHYITIKAWYRRESNKPTDIGMPTYQSEKHEEVNLDDLYERIKNG